MSGRADTASAFDPAAGLMPAYAVAAMVARLGRAPKAVEDSLSVDALLFEVETGRVLARATARAGVSALRATAAGLAGDLSTRRPRHTAAPGRMRRPPEVAAMGRGLVDLVRHDLGAAARDFAVGAAGDSTYDALGRAARATAPFLDRPLPAVAVGDFAGYYGPDPAGGQNIGEGVGQMLMTELLVRGLRVVERESLDAMLQEQELEASDRVDPATGARVGHIIPARYLVSGTVLAVADSVVLEAQVVDARSGAAMPVPPQRAPVADFPGAVVRFGEEIAQVINRQPSDVSPAELVGLADLLTGLGLDDVAAAYRAMAETR
jgi:TolB-like protein